MNRCFYDIGEDIMVGDVPRHMLAFTLRADRFGEPLKSMRIEKVEVPSKLGDHEVLVYVMAAGVNHNVIWAGRAKPLNVIRNSQKIDNDQRKYFIPGSDGAGIVWKVGTKVTNFKIGDEVILQSGYLGPEETLRTNIDIKMPNIRAWGYEVNGGTLAQFTRVQSYQCIKKPNSLSWAEAACFLVSAATAYKMLCCWDPNIIKKDDPVLIWGGASGIGCMAIQICNMVGAKPVAVVSSQEKEEYCKKIGAIGCINRTFFKRWGRMVNLTDQDKHEEWRIHVKDFRKAFCEALGEERGPKIVFEHPGEETLATSLAIVEREGMVVICGGTSGYYGSFDLRQLWVYQKRIQGSHFAAREQCVEIVDLVAKKRINPCLSTIYSFEDAAMAHQLMAENKHSGGNSAILVNTKI